MSALRVLFVIPGEPEGNSMIFARRQARALSAAGVGVECFYLASRTAPLKLWREWRRLRAAIAGMRPDLVHAHFGTVTALVTVLAAGRTPVVITYRGSDLNRLPGLRAWLGRCFSQLAALKAARIVCVSARLRERMWWRRRIATVLPSGVDLAEFYPRPRAEARAALGWPPQDRVVLFNAGRGAALKRLDLALAAFERARAALPGLRLEILRGDTPPERMPLVMNAADCLLLTSDAEGSPTVVQEALASNLPVVSVDVGDVAERLEGMEGTRVAARDPDALARMLVELLSEPRRAQTRERARELSAERIARELAGLYRSAAGA